MKFIKKHYHATMLFFFQPIPVVLLLDDSTVALWLFLDNFTKHMSERL